MTLVAEIRDADASERGALSEIHRRSSYVWDEDRAMLDRHPEVLGVAAEAIAERRVRVAVGAGGSLLGYSSVAERPDGACELDGLFVEPGHLREGIGRALVADAAERARHAGCLRMTVVTHARSVPFYEHVGFVVGEPVQTQFAPALRMWCELGSSGPPRHVTSRPS